ncbi:MAG TPA: SMP-30/gluconolactonase/LRE family protein, partial [Vicinamibacterales bacterium]|nr:SMP-30/gluconolactonase/LRE family protein [Vicinamibacterales bacterium]
MTDRAIATLGLTIALSALLCAQQVPPPPAPLPPPEGAPITPALSRLLTSHDEPVRVATGLGSLAGIVWTKVGTLFVAEVTQSIIIEWSPIAGPHPLRGTSGGALGLALDGAGRVLAAERTARRVTRSDLINGTMTILDRVGGAPLGGPIGVAITPDNTLYVSDVNAGSGRIIRVDPAGVATVIATDLVQPTGLAVSANGNTLFVSDSARAELRAYALSQKESAAPGRRLASITPWKSGVSGRPAGLALDKDGRIYLAGPGGIWVMDQNGGRLGVIA